LGGGFGIPNRSPDPLARREGPQIIPFQCVPPLLGGERERERDREREIEREREKFY
jgi:hypothetical protein